ILCGWALAEQGQGEEGIAQIHQGLAAYRAIGSELWRSYYLALLAEAYGKVGRAEAGLKALAEALAQVEKTGEHFYEAELYRLKGELTLAQSSVQSPESRVRRSPKSKVQSPESKVSIPQSTFRNPQLEAEAEACFLKAIEIARRQQAKSLELRAVMSLVRLQQQQVTDSASRHTHHASRARLNEAHTMLAETYSWFTEGFDTKD